MNRSLRRMRIMGILALGAMGILLWQFVLSPRFTEPQTIQAEVTSTLNEKANLDEEGAVLINRSRLLDAAINEANLLNCLMPSTASEPELATAVTDAAVKAGMSTGQITVLTTSSLTEVADTTKTAAAPATTPAPNTTAAPADPNNVKVDTNAAKPAATLKLYQMSVSIQAVGTADQLVAFVNNLYTAKRAIAVDNITLVPDVSHSGTATGLYSLTLAGRAFVVQNIGNPPAQVQDTPKVTGEGANGTSTSTPSVSSTPTVSPTASK